MSYYSAIQTLSLQDVSIRDVVQEFRITFLVNLLTAFLGDYAKEIFAAVHLFVWQSSSDFVPPRYQQTVLIARKSCTFFIGGIVIRDYVFRLWHR